LAELKSNLAPQELDSLWTNGRTMSTDAIIMLALQEGDGAGA
jgi:hypothetical protein